MRRMTNGQNCRIVTLTLPKVTDAFVTDAANKLGISKSAYVNIIISEAVRNGESLKLAKTLSFFQKTKSHLRIIAITLLT